MADEQEPEATAAKLWDRLRYEAVDTSHAVAMIADELNEAERRGREAEREACLKIAGDLQVRSEEHGDYDGMHAAKVIAGRIRARGE